MCFPYHKLLASMAMPSNSVAFWCEDASHRHKPTWPGYNNKKKKTKKQYIQVHLIRG